MEESVFADTIGTGKDAVKERRLMFVEYGIQEIFTGSKVEDLGNYPVITPAFIDPHSQTGMIRSGEWASEQETNEDMDSRLARAEVLDSVQMDDGSFKDSIEPGVLYYILRG